MSEPETGLVCQQGCKKWLADERERQEFVRLFTQSFGRRPSSFSDEGISATSNESGEGE